MNAHRLPTMESLEALSRTLNGWQCKSSCTFPHVTAQGLKARTPLETVAPRAVSQDVYVFFPGMPVPNVEINIVPEIISLLL